MEDSFKFSAALKSDEELHERINNREKYLPDTVEAAVEELQTRGEGFSDEELKVIGEDMQARRNLAGTPPDTFGTFNSRDKNNLVDDPDAPSLFSRRVVYIFSILFSVFFGSVMLAINIAKTPNKSKAIWVILYGLGYTVAVVVIAENLKLNSTFTIVTCVAGAYLMEALFWNRFIGKATLYRARPIWIPLIVGLAIAVPIITLIIYSGLNNR